MARSRCCVVRNQHIPVLTGIKFRTRVVSSGSAIIVNITYSDEDNNAPVEFTLDVSGSSNNFVRVGTGENYIGGVLFTCNVTLGTGLHALSVNKCKNAIFLSPDLFIHLLTDKLC
jgi:hypothetical protein